MSETSVCIVVELRKYKVVFEICSVQALCAITLLRVKLRFDLVAVVHLDLRYDC